MILKVNKSEVSGTVKIPGSKSHTIRAVYLASLADGVSEISDWLDSLDTQSSIGICNALGAIIEKKDNKLIITGVSGKPKFAENLIDVGNSGTSLRIGISVAALGEKQVSFTGDSQIQRRPLKPLLRALHNMGVNIHCEKHNDMVPLSVKGPMKGGSVSIDAVSSQFLTSLLIACPLCDSDTTIDVTNLNEKPYVELTLWWLDKMGIKYTSNSELTHFSIKGRQKYRHFNQPIPADFSSATFFLVLAAISGKEFFLENLDMSDTQGDKDVVKHLEAMGAKIKIEKNGVRIKGDKLVGRKIDMNAIPDALPAMAVAGCFAEGVTVLHNVPQARLKETDRISVMFTELKKMGADIEELSDALIIKGSKLNSANLNGHNDHRIIMALTIAGLNVDGLTTIDTAEAVNITFPDFFKLLKKNGADISYVL